MPFTPSSMELSVILRVVQYCEQIFRQNKIDCRHNGAFFLFQAKQKPKRNASLFHWLHLWCLQSTYSYMLALIITIAVSKSSFIYIYLHFIYKFYGCCWLLLHIPLHAQAHTHNGEGSNVGSTEQHKYKSCYEIHSKTATQENGSNCRKESQLALANRMCNLQYVSISTKWWTGKREQIDGWVFEPTNPLEVTIRKCWGKVNWYIHTINLVISRSHTGARHWLFSLSRFWLCDYLNFGGNFRKKCLASSSLMDQIAVTVLHFSWTSAKLVQIDSFSAKRFVAVAWANCESKWKIVMCSFISILY